MTITKNLEDYQQVDIQEQMIDENTKVKDHKYSDMLDVLSNTIREESVDTFNESSTILLEMEKNDILFFSDPSLELYRHWDIFLDEEDESL